jgi:2-polyprenyl-6-hydroxyphenyl methylase/3-demethylubiquinone-9 3-methyltransferase
MEMTVAEPDNQNATESPRFPFGRNWASFLGVLTEARIQEAERSLREMLGAERLASAAFLDAGSGSGLFSLAAMRLGARRVHSFDFDPESVACARELRRRYFPDAQNWTVEQGSVLDPDYMNRLGQWDIVYSWGVLHHTGRMWEGLALVISHVKQPGLLFVSIYNDQGRMSTAWRFVKRLYNTGPVGRVGVISVFVPYFAVRGLAIDLMRGRSPAARYKEYRTSRGMSLIHDWKDWLGGYPFEVAKPEEVFEFCRSRGFSLEKLTTCGGRFGCNEFVFNRPA